VSHFLSFLDNIYFLGHITDSHKRKYGKISLNQGKLENRDCGMKCFFYSNEVSRKELIFNGGRFGMN
jgi:hypothetical protein